MGYIIYTDGENIAGQHILLIFFPQNRPLTLNTVR